VKWSLRQFHTTPGRSSLSHANAPLTELGRLRLALCVVDDGWPLRRAAEGFQVSPVTAKRWADRYRAQGPAGMADRSSRPRRSPNRTPLLTERKVLHLRRSKRLGPARIGWRLGLPASTCHAILRRAGQPRLAHLDRGAGAWLGEALAPAGFAWMPRGKRLQRQAGTLVHQVHLQPKRWNRQGQSAEFGTMLNVRDPALKAWRHTNTDRVRQPLNDYVCGHLLGYASGRVNGYLYGDAQDGDVDLTDPAQREHRLEAFASMFRMAVLPWFDEASDPERIVKSRAGDYTNNPSALVEWLASRDRADLIDEYIQRYLSAIRPRDRRSRKAPQWQNPECRLPSSHPATPR
jgi:hypothetical protein